MDGIIFDIDGTLWNATDTVAEAWNRAIAEHSDLKLNVKPLLKNLFGLTMDELYDRLFPSLSKNERMELGKYCFEYENKLLETKPGILYEGVRETLNTLAKKAKLYIVSNCQLGYIEAFLAGSGLSDVIKGHLCFGDTNTSKGQTLLKLMEIYSLKDVVYVGDTTGDQEACKEAGIPFIYASYGFGKVKDASVTINKISELTELFP